jgi:hypothetical protein
MEGGAREGAGCPGDCAGCGREGDVERFPLSERKVHVAGSDTGLSLRCSREAQEGRTASFACEASGGSIRFGPCEYTES